MVYVGLTRKDGTIYESSDGGKLYVLRTRIDHTPEQLVAKQKWKRILEADYNGTILTFERLKQDTDM